MAGRYLFTVVSSDEGEREEEVGEMKRSQPNCPRFSLTAYYSTSMQTGRSSHIWELVWLNRCPPAHSGDWGLGCLPLPVILRPPKRANHTIIVGYLRDL